MKLEFVRTVNMIADIMTEGLESLKHENFRKAFEVINGNDMTSMENDQGNTSNSLDRESVLEVFGIS